MKPIKDNTSSIRENETLPYEPENENTYLDSQFPLSRRTKPSHRIVVTWNMKNSRSKGSQYIFNQIHEDCSLERITCGFHEPGEGKRSQDKTSVGISERDKPILTWYFPSISTENVTFATKKTCPRSNFSNIQKSISTSDTLSQQSAFCSRQGDTESTELQDLQHIKVNCSEKKQTTKHPIQVTEATDLKACKEASIVKPGSKSMTQTTSSHIHPHIPTSISVNPEFEPESQTKIGQTHPEVTATLDVNSESEPVSQTTRDLTQPQNTTTSYLYPGSVTQTKRSQIRTQVMETIILNPDIELESRTMKKQIPAQVVESPNVKTRSEDVSTTNKNETDSDVTVEPDLNPASDKTRYETATNTAEGQIHIKVTTTDRKSMIGSDSKYKSHIHSPYTLARDRLPAPIQSCESVIELTITDLTAAHRDHPEITVTEPTTNRAISDLRSQVSQLRDRLRYLEHKSSRTKYTSMDVKKTSEEITQIQNRLCTFSRSMESLLNQNGLPRTAISTVERQTKISDVNVKLILAPGGCLRRNLPQRSFLSDDDSTKSLGNGSLKPEGSLKCQPPRLVGVRARGQNFKSLQSESRRVGVDHVRGWNYESECRSFENTVGHRSDISNSTFETGSLYSEPRRNILHSSPTMDHDQDAKRRRQTCIISSKRFIPRIISDSDSGRGTIIRSDRTSGSGVENEVATSTIGGSSDRQNSLHDLDYVPELLKSESPSSCSMSAERRNRGVNKCSANRALQNTSGANTRQTSEVVRQSNMDNVKDKVDVSSQAAQDVMRVTGGGCDCEKDPASCICETTKICKYPSCRASKSEQDRVKRKLSIFIPGEALYLRSNSVISEESYSNRDSTDRKSSVSEPTTTKKVCAEETCKETKMCMGEACCETEENQSSSKPSKTNGKAHIDGQEEDVKMNAICGLGGLCELRKQFIRTLLPSKSRKRDKEVRVDETNTEILQRKLDEMSEDLDEQKKATDELFAMCKGCNDMYNDVTKKLNEVIEEVEALGIIVRGTERKISDMEPIFTRPSNAHSTLSSFGWKHLIAHDSLDKFDTLEERSGSFENDDGRQSCNHAVGFSTSYIDPDSRVTRQASQLNQECKPDNCTRLNPLRLDENRHIDHNSPRDQLSPKEEKNQDNNSKKSILLLRAEDHSSWKSYLFHKYGKLQSSHTGSVQGGIKLNNYSGNGVIDPENETKRNSSSVMHPFVMKIYNRSESKSQNGNGTKLENISRNSSFRGDGRKSDNRSFVLEDEVKSDKTSRKFFSVSQNETKSKNSSQMSPFVHQTANKSDIVPQESDFLLQDEAKSYNTLLVSKDKNKSDNRSLASSFTRQTGTKSRSSLRNKLILSQERMRTDSYSQRYNYVSQDELKSNNYPQRSRLAAPAQEKSGENSQKHTTFSPGSENSANNLRREPPHITSNGTKLDSRSRIVSIDAEDEHKDESLDGKKLKNISKKSFSIMQPPRASCLGKNLQRNSLGLFSNGEIKQDTNLRRSSLLFLENNISQRRTATPHNKNNSESIPQCSSNRIEDNLGNFLQTKKRKRRRSKTSLGHGSENSSLPAPIIIPTCQRPHCRKNITELSAIAEESVEDDKKTKRKHNCVFL